MSIDLVKNGDFHVTRSAGHGLCYICACKKQSGDPGIFRAEQIEYEGMLDICVRCIRHAANQIGMLSTEDVNRIRAELATGHQKLKDLQELVSEQERALAALGYLGDQKQSGRQTKAKVKT